MKQKLAKRTNIEHENFSDQRAEDRVIFVAEVFEKVYFIG